MYQRLIGNHNLYAPHFALNVLDLSKYNKAVECGREVPGMKKIGIGYENYKEFIDGNMYYVDKTLLIRDVIELGGKVTLFTRPRRFGKTLALSMLRTFFELEYDFYGNLADNRRYFTGKKIMDASEEILSMMGRYPVIKLSLKSAKQPNYREAALALRDEIVSEFDRHTYIKDSEKLTIAEATLFNNLSCPKDRDELEDEIKLKAEIGRYATALKTLSVCLKKYHNENVVVLIDEYDVPLENAYYNGFYDEMVRFIRSLFESVLKTNDALQFGVVTGCLRISKESIFTGLNNLEINSIMTTGYGEYFGFTDGEVRKMLSDYGIPDKYDETRDWYDGYMFGGVNVYNPWSTALYVKHHLGDGRNSFPVSYWANTSSNSIVKDLVERADNDTKGEIEKLIEGGSIEKPVHEDITYDEIYKSQDNLWNFMFFTGYLKIINERTENDVKYATLVVPNRETRYIYRQKIINWFSQEIVEKSDRSGLFSALLSGDAKGFEREINKLLRPSISYMDSYENFYHGFMTGILLGSNVFTVKSNRESGSGRSDILIKPVSVFDRAFVIELKTVKPKNGRKVVTSELMDAEADEALRQITDMHYTDALEDDGYGAIGRYGISFFRKDCRVHYLEGYPE